MASMRGLPSISAHCYKERRASEVTRANLVPPVSSGEVTAAIGGDGNPLDELQFLQHDCRSMVQALKRLHEEEMRLRAQNAVLAREAAETGFRGEMETAWAAKKRKAAAKKAAAEKDGVAGGSGVRATAEGPVASIIPSI